MEPLPGPQTIQTSTNKTIRGRRQGAQPGKSADPVKQGNRRVRATSFPSLSSFLSSTLWISWGGSGRGRWHPDYLLPVPSPPLFARPGVPLGLPCLSLDTSRSLLDRRRPLRWLRGPKWLPKRPPNGTQMESILTKSDYLIFATPLYQ